MNDSRETIFALSTPPGRSGVAVIRISGPAARFALETLCPPLPEPRQAALRWLCDLLTGEKIDQALVLWMPGPASFTGEDCAELQVHGSRAVVAAVLEALGELDGLGPAAPGDFARRAFDNGRLDLAEVEGLADLIDAETEGQRRQAVRQMGGALSRVAEAWRERLVETAALIEAEIDFSDEGDVPADLRAEARALARQVGAEIGAELALGRAGERLRSGLKVVIAGPVNAGKSTLMNALAGRDVAIVSERAGTTRDVIEVHLDVNGYAVMLVDTAGLRDSDDEVEEEGIRRARAAMADADLVLSLRPVGCEAKAEAAGDDRVLDVVTKIDLAAPAAFDRVGHETSTGETPIPVSATSGQGLEALIAAIGERAAALGGAGADPLITRARHRAAFADCRAALERFEALAQDHNGGVELLAEELRAAARALARITGRIDVEDVLGRLFSSFCIGK